MEWQDRFLNITWQKFNLLTYQLSQNIKKGKNNFDLIVAIARGGLTLSQILSDSLNLPIAAFTVESYKNLKQEKLPHITYGLSTPLNGKKILLADDVCDSGKTFLRGIAYLQELGAKKENITTCALHFKPHAKYKPHYFAEQTSAWVIYPYEVRETVVQLVPLWEKEHVTKQEMKLRFLKFEFPQSQVDTFLST